MPDLSKGIAPPQPSARTRLTVWLTLLLLAAIAWAIMLQHLLATGSMNQGMATLSHQPESALIFIPLWVSMMVAMMFPSIAPVVALFATLNQNRRALEQPAAPTWLFVAGYLAIWTLFGIGVYLLSWLLPALGMMASGLQSDSPVIGGIILIYAGIYQLTPLKGLCLRHCRSPLSIVLHGWQDGAKGAFRMGVAHGGYCLGCCWGLMLVLFAVGLMNLSWMMLLSLLIFVEKVTPYGVQIARGSALLFLGYGGYLIIQPLLS